MWNPRKMNRAQWEELLLFIILAAFLVIGGMSLAFSQGLPSLIPWV